MRMIRLTIVNYGRRERRCRNIKNVVNARVNSVLACSFSCFIRIAELVEHAQRPLLFIDVIRIAFWEYASKRKNPTHVGNTNRKLFRKTIAIG